MTSRNRRLTQAREIKERTRRPPGEFVKCSVMSCKRQTQFSAGTGLSQAFCKPHMEFYRRHGSTWCKSYSKPQLAPYRLAAKRWIKANSDELLVHRATFKLQRLMDTSGKPRSTYDLRALPPVDKARSLLASLREEGVTGLDVLAIAIAVKAAYSELGPRGNPDFYHMQIAKVLHRMVPPTTKTTSGFPLPIKYHRGEGRYMRLVGEWVDEAASIVLSPEVVSAVLAMKASKAAPKVAKADQRRAIFA